MPSNRQRSRQAFGWYTALSVVGAVAVCAALAWHVALLTGPGGAEPLRFQGSHDQARSSRPPWIESVSRPSLERQGASWRRRDVVTAPEVIDPVGLVPRRENLVQFFERYAEQLSKLYAAPLPSPSSDGALPDVPRVNPHDVLVTSNLDGSISALDRTDGSLLWTINATQVGGDLVKSAPIPQSASDSVASHPAADIEYHGTDAVSLHILDDDRSDRFVVEPHFHGRIFVWRDGQPVSVSGTSDESAENDQSLTSSLNRNYQ